MPRQRPSLAHVSDCANGGLELRELSVSGMERKLLR